MDERRERRTNLLAAVLVLVLLIVAGYQLRSMRATLAEAQAEQSVLAGQVRRQEQVNRSLEAALDRAEDPEYLRQLARERLGMVSPGQKDFYDISN